MHGTTSYLKLTKLESITEKSKHLESERDFLTLYHDSIIYKGEFHMQP